MSPPPEERLLVRWKFSWFSLTLLFLILFSPLPAQAGEKWYETGRSDKVPQSRYLTGLGYGSTLDRARKDAARNLANQIDSDIRSNYEQKTSRNNMAISRSTRDILAVRTHAKLYGLKNVRGKFVQAQGAYVALVAVDRNDLVRYLKGRIRTCRKTISSLREDLGNTSNPMRQIHDLSGIVRAKEKAAFFDREVAAVSGGTPSSLYNTQSEISRIETLLSRDATVSVSIVNDCGQIDSFARHVREAVEQDVTRMGLLVVPAGGRIRITGHVSATPLPPNFSRRYHYYVLRYALSMSAPDGTVWGTVVHQRKVAGLDPAQAELLASRTVSKKGVGPLLDGLKSRLFLDKGDPRFVSFPRESSSNRSSRGAGSPLSRNCQGFGD